MSLPYANYEAIPFSASTSFPTGRERQMGNTGSTGYITATTVHQIYCLSAGAITITPMKGPAFTWNATTNSSIDVLVSSVTVSSGTYVAFRAKLQNQQFYSSQL